MKRLNQMVNAFNGEQSPGPSSDMVLHENEVKKSIKKKQLKDDNLKSKLNFKKFKHNKDNSFSMTSDSEEEYKKPSSSFSNKMGQSFNNVNN